MDDFDALYETICQQPGESTPRLMYADLLDERNEAGDQNRAQFIRAQVELARIGPPRLRVEGNAKLKSPYRWTVAVDGYEVRVGQRVDLHFVREDSVKALWRKPLPGLLVERVQPLDRASGLVTLHLHKDDYADRYPYDRVTELNKVCRKTGAQWPTWVRLPDGCGFAALNPNRPAGHFTSLLYMPAAVRSSGSRYGMTVTVTAGFCSRVCCSYAVWESYGDLFSRYNPISRVELLDEPSSEVIRLSNTESVFSLIPPNNATVITMTDKEYASFGDGDEPEREVDRRLLAKRWPKVIEWQTNCAENRLYHVGEPLN